VIERAVGKSLGEMAHERIFEPLGMQGSLMYDDHERIIPMRATGYDLNDEGGLRIVHNYNFDVAGDGQLYTTVEDLLLWDNYLHGTEKPATYPMMLTEGTLNDGEPIGRAQGIFLGEYRGLRTVGHSGSSWGFRTQLLRLTEPALSIAIACNADFADPGDLARRVADHYLADRLQPDHDSEESVTEQPLAELATPPTKLTADQLAEYEGVYYSTELDATYRFAVVDGGLVVRIEQEPSLDVLPLSADRFEFLFQPRGWPSPQPVRLQFDRNRSGNVTGFGLSSGTERGIVFERR
jgi:CubicO group peptidase (beta-lactamase class C family)